MSTNADRRIALQFVSETLGGTSTTDTILKRANAYADFLSNGRLPTDPEAKPEEEFDPLSPE
jgi:hypothetical protein